MITNLISKIQIFYINTYHIILHIKKMLGETFFDDDIEDVNKVEVEKKKKKNKTASKKAKK